jgi:chorismate synthase
MASEITEEVGDNQQRETVARVLAGAVAKMYLKSEGVFIQAYVSQVYHIKLEKRLFSIRPKSNRKRMWCVVPTQRKQRR